MRYSIEPKYIKYVEGYEFLSFARKCRYKYSKKLMNTATKTRIDATKTASQRIIQKNCRSCKRFDWK